jgi:glycosyltransferase involved in cell wall biosynthesis
LSIPGIGKVSSMNRSGAPLLSVVIPAYNNAGTLAEAIASVRSQAGPCREIIVVDDGSSDATAQIYNELDGPDLRLIRQLNVGPGAARNRGIAAARGEWIALLDADDVWLPAKLEVQFVQLEQAPEARFCFAGHVVRMPDGTEHLHECRLPERSIFIDLLKGNRLPTSTAVVRRDCFAEAGLFDTTLRTGEDWDMWLRLTAMFQGVLVPQPMEVYRKSANSQKYPVELLDRCTNRVLDRLFSNSRIAALHPELAGLRRRVYGWHHSVLAKSYYQHRRFYRSGRRALSAIQMHPSGALCLLPKATAPW